MVHNLNLGYQRMELEDKLRYERTQIVAEYRLQSEDIKCSYSPIGI